MIEAENSSNKLLSEIDKPNVPKTFNLSLRKLSMKKSQDQDLDAFELDDSLPCVSVRTDLLNKEKTSVLIKNPFSYEISAL